MTQPRIFNVLFYYHHESADKPKISFCQDSFEQEYKVVKLKNNPVPSEQKQPDNVIKSETNLPFFVFHGW